MRTVWTDLVMLSLFVVFFLTLGLSVESSSRNQFPSVESQTSQAVVSVASVGSVQIRPKPPTRLIIPKLNVDAALQYVGLTANGEMGVPEAPGDAAWLSVGPRPGEEGTAVISGHYGWKEDIPAVFDDLSKLQKGDKLYVEDQNGVPVTFVVREVQTYGATDSASEVFVSSDGKAHLNLITCEGTWNPDQKSYSGRLVVFTDKMY